MPREPFPLARFFGLGLTTILGVACSMPAAKPRPIVRGPLPTRIMQPAGLIFPVPRPRRAAVLGPGELTTRIDTTYSSIFENNAVGLDEASFDGEVARVSAQVRYGLGDGLDLAIEPSVLFGSSGTLDRIVDSFHGATGLPGGGRDDVPRGQYSMRLVREGVEAFELKEDELLFGDLPISLTATLREEDASGPGIATRVTVELPSGNEARGSGSGGIDVAAGVILEQTRGRWTFFGGLDGMQVSEPRRFRDAGIDVRSVFLANGGVEYRWSHQMSLLFQAVLQMPLTRDLDLEEINREILNLGFGVSRDLTRDSRITASFHEDAIAASGPDVTLFVGLDFDF